MLPDASTSAPPLASAPLSFARRAEPAELPELMDQPCAYEDLRACLRDLGRVNRLLRGYAPTLAFLRRAAKLRSSGPLRILDVGSGGGDTLRVIARWAHDRKIPVELTGVDLNPHCTRAALEATAHDAFASHTANLHFLTADVFTYAPQHPPDIILSALFTHHLSSPEVVHFLQWINAHARLGWFINDLHRSARAAFWYRPLASLLRWHRFVRHDGPVSIHRAFIPADWQHFIAAANIPDATIESHAFNRLCVSCLHPQPHPQS